MANKIVGAYLGAGALRVAGSAAGEVNARRTTRKRFVVLGLLLCLGASNAFAVPKPADWSQNDWEKFIEEGVQIGLGEALNSVGSATPMVDIYSGLSAIGSSTNVGLRLWLNRKMQDAEDQNNMALVDKYQAYASCLDGDCSKLKQLAESGGGGGGGASAAPGAGSACLPVQTINQPESRERHR